MAELLKNFEPKKAEAPPVESAPVAATIEVAGETKDFSRAAQR